MAMSAIDDTSPLPSTRHAALALAAQALNATRASGVQTALPLPNVIRMAIDNWDVLRDVGEFLDPDGRQQSAGPHVVPGDNGTPVGGEDTTGPGDPRTSSRSDELERFAGLS
ncbi:hypothetical protein C8Q74DRAFT_1221249 [Fomes fomentarius]|nr:hypothetical protein C8Q74DRAFT_1221249 [Fomes fomentarius]